MQSAVEIIRNRLHVHILVTFGSFAIWSEAIFKILPSHHKLYLLFCLLSDLIYCTEILDIDHSTVLFIYFIGLTTEFK